MYDVIVAGGGPAGMSASLLLARARRSVLLLDTGQGRNTKAEATHLLLSRDGTSPEEVRSAALEQLGMYPNVRFQHLEAVSATGTRGDFQVTLADSTVESARRLVLATGVRDILPSIDGLSECWGRSVFICPYCDGWEVRDRPLAILVDTAEDVRFAAILTRWTERLTVTSAEDFEFSSEDREMLLSLGAQVHDTTIARVQSTNGAMQRAILADGSEVDCSALFVHPPTRQRSDLAKQLGCNLLDDESVEIDHSYSTTVPGVYAAGDMARPIYQPVPIAYVATAASSGLVTGSFLDADLFGASFEQ